MTSFEVFGLHEKLLAALAEQGYTTPTPIQAQAIPPILRGDDVIGIAQTGTGKTAAFVLPILHRIATQPKTLPRGTPRALVLVPTRELAMQVAQSVATYGKGLAVHSLAIYGGVSQGPQVHTLSKSISILIATPGRLLDLWRQKHVHLDAVEMIVLDEADRMLEMGFTQDLQQIVRELPRPHQTLLFSATLSEEVASLTHKYMQNPFRVAVTAQATTVGKITQIVHFVDSDKKLALLKRILVGKDVTRAIVFVRMKHVADKIVAKLAAEGVEASALHSDKTQAMRTQTLEDFRSGKVPVLLATDIAARGLDVDDISHVINYDLPKDAQTYVHRIGRTARAGAYGNAITFCNAEDRPMLLSIERLINVKLTIKEHKYHSHYAQVGGMMSTPKKTEAPARTGRGGGRSKITSNHNARQSKKWVQK